MSKTLDELAKAFQPAPPRIGTKWMLACADGCVCTYYDDPEVAWIWAKGHLAIGHRCALLSPGTYEEPLGAWYITITAAELKDS